MTPAEFKVIRERLGLKREALAVRLGVAGTTIYRWETGRQPIPQLAQLAMWALREMTDSPHDWAQSAGGPR